MSQITLSDIPQELKEKIGSDSVSYTSFVEAFSSYENDDFLDFREESFESLPSKAKIAYFNSKLQLEKHWIDSFSSITK